MTTGKEHLVLVDPKDDANQTLYQLVKKLPDITKTKSNLKMQHLNIKIGATVRVLKFKRKKGAAGRSAEDPHYGEVTVLYKNEVRFAFDF
jgi:hypothetical protein